MTYRLVMSVVKIALASLLVGVALAAVNITPEQILKDVGLTPDQLIDYARRGVRWAVPHVILGAFVTVPIWLVIYLLRPPGGD